MGFHDNGNIFFYKRRLFIKYCKNCPNSRYSKYSSYSRIVKFGQNCEIWPKLWNLVKILKFCLQILYLKIFHLKILNWICRQCVDCQVRNIDSDCLLLEKSTVTLASRLSTYWRPPKTPPNPAIHIFFIVQRFGLVEKENWNVLIIPRWRSSG